MVSPAKDKQIENRLTPPSREKLNEKIVSQVKGLIFSNGIQVGQRLPSERDLAQRFHVSRVVVREALKSLEQSGLLDIRTGAMGGAFVTNNQHIPLLNSAYDLWNGGRLTLRHFVEVRKAVECASVRLAAEKATNKDIEHLRSLNRKLIDDLDQREKLRRDNQAFHVAIAEISGNPLIVLIVRSLLVLVHTLVPPNVPARYRSFIKEMHARHTAVIDAMEARDLVRCEEMMSRETESTRMLKKASRGSAQEA